MGSTTIFRLLALLAVMHMAVASPTEETECPSADCINVGQWELGISLGLGLRTNPLINSADIPLVLIPHISYYGERFFIEDLELGYTLYDHSALMLNSIATVGYDSVYYNRWDAGNLFISLNGLTGERETIKVDLTQLHEHKMAVLAGFEGSGALGQLEWQLQILKDISQVHEGEEIRLAFGLNSDSSSWQIRPSLGLTWKSKDLINYYYGIYENEVYSGAALYVGRATLNSFIKLTATKRINADWQFKAMWQYEALGAGITDSPLVEEDHVVTAFIGSYYQF